MANYIIHYASPYYDPVKAHEYYMRTRELKGRTSTAGLNDEGKAAAKYVRNQLQTERKSKSDQDREVTKSQIKAHSEKMKTEIATLRAQLKGLSKADREARRPEIQAKIDQLRAENKAQRETLYAELKVRNEGRKTEYDSKYEAELKSMLADPKFQKTKEE